MTLEEYVKNCILSLHNDNYTETNLQNTKKLFEIIISFLAGTKGNVFNYNEEVMEKFLDGETIEVDILGNSILFSMDVVGNVIVSDSGEESIQARGIIADFKGALLSKGIETTTWGTVPQYYC